jgi:hypothetical protein
VVCVALRKGRKDSLAIARGDDRSGDFSQHEVMSTGFNHDFLRLRLSIVRGALIDCVQIGSSSSSTQHRWAVPLF